MTDPLRHRLRRRRLLILTELLFWLLGGICVSIFLYAQLASGASQRKAIDAFRERTADVDQTLWSQSRIDHYDRAVAADLEVTALGILSIPAIELEVAIFDGTSPRVLNIGIGRVAGTATIDEMSNLALAGHRDGFFRGLKDLAVGDELVVEGLQQTVRYVVSDIFVVDPEDVSVLDRTDERMLTLITCYPFYFVGHAPQRFIVRAVAKK